MNEETINDTQGKDPQNWSGPKWLSLYFSKSDSRLWVRKQIPELGWTINLGHRRGVAWLLGIVVSILLFVVFSNIAAMSFIAR